MTAGRRPVRGGALVAAVWLIGLGTIFLVQDYSDWSWTQAWPMFVILVGFGMLASSSASGRRRWAGSWSLVWPIAWIGVGAILLASTTGQLGMEPGELVARWWPLVPIGAGIWFLVAAVWPGRSRPVESLDLPLTGTDRADIQVRFGAGELNVGRSTPGRLVSGSFSGGVHAVERGPGSVSLEPDLEVGPWPWGQPLTWRLGVTGEVPLNLRVESGAARARLDLTDTLLARLDLKTAASETEIRLPQAAGTSAVHVESGAASVTIIVPDGVAARIRSRMALGSVQVDEARFPRSADGYASPGYEAAEHRVDLDLQGGVGSIRVS